MLELLHGPDRTANSMELLARICENAAHGVAGQILIVPEQYSHETERALCGMKEAYSHIPAINRL